MADRLQCDHCGEMVLPISGVSAIWDRGYWWHASCCQVFFDQGQVFVSFPSDGKLVPPTILRGEADV